MSARRLFAAALHMSSAAIMYWGYNAMGGTALDDWIMQQKCGHTQFLTIQAMALSVLTMLLALGSDFLPNFRLLKQVKRTLAMISLPLEIVVSLVYWSLVFFFPELIIQKLPIDPEPSASTLMPQPFRMRPEVDIALHAVPAITLLLDFVLFEKRYTQKEVNYGATAMAIGMALWYGTWVEYCASHNGVFPYPFLTFNPFSTRVVIYLAVTSVALVSLRVINALHKYPVFAEDDGLQGHSSKALDDTKLDGDYKRKD